jgi:hypothetical protein
VFPEESRQRLGTAPRLWWAPVGRGELEVRPDAARKKEVAFMRRIILMLVVAALMAAMLAASAFPAFAQGERGVGPGKCIVPGTLFRGSAQEPGPNQYFGGPPGQGVKNECTPASPFI